MALVTISKNFSRKLTSLSFLSSILLVSALSGCGKGVSTDVPESRSDASYSQWLADHQIQSKDTEIVQLAEQITRGEVSEIGKASAIHDWVVANIQYDQALFNQVETDSTATEIDSSYDQCIATRVLHTRRGICDGYSSLTASLLIAAGIPSKMVTGTLTDQSTPCDHEWNKALVDGNWIILDTTFDAGGWGRQFFNPAPAFFAETHQECNESSGN
jgi:transglutaminase/protease-like cytokinesis protein 3